jgi:hypothetical protein
VAPQRLVSAGSAQFWVEVEEASGPTTVRDDGGVLSFDGVRATVEGIAAELTQAWASVKPTEASVAFGLKLTAKSGKLTGLLVEGGGEASLTVTLTWKQPAGGSSQNAQEAERVAALTDGAEPGPVTGGPDRGQ